VAFEVANLDHLGDVLEVDLVADAHSRGHEREVVERLLGPTQQRVALMVALDLSLDVAARLWPIGRRLYDEVGGGPLGAASDQLLETCGRQSLKPETQRLARPAPLRT